MENQIYSKIINTCITCPESKLDQPLKILMSFPDSKKILEMLTQSLTKSRDISTKQRASTLIQTYLMQNSSKLNASPEELINILQLITTETPLTIQKELIDQFCKCIELIISLVKSIPISKIFNQIVSTPYPYSAITLALLTKNDTKYTAPTLKFIVAVQKEPNPLSFYAASLFFNYHKPSEFTSDVEKEFKLEVFKSSLISAFNLKKIHKLSAIQLLNSLFKTATTQICSSIVSSMIETFINVLKEPDPEIRTELVKALTDLPPEVGFLNELLTGISYRLDDCDDEYGKAAISFVFSRRAIATLPAILKNIIEAKETYIAGVIFSARLGLFSESSSLLHAVFQTSPKQTVALAALQGICVMCNFKLMTDVIFTQAFNTIQHCLTSSTHLDDIILTYRAFKALELLPQAVTAFPGLYLDTIIKSLQVIKEDDVIAKICQSAWKVFSETHAIPSAINASVFSNVFTSMALRYLESEDDEEYQMDLVHMMSILSSAAHKKSVTLELPISKLILTAVPDEYSDAVRTEANILMQTKPIAVMISVSLPKIAPFLPSLTRAVRESDPPDLKLVDSFIKAGLTSCGQGFLTYLRKFMEPVERSSKYFIISIKRKTKGFIPEVLDGVSYATQLDDAENYIGELIKIVDEALESAEAISAMKTNVFNAVDNLMKKCGDAKFPSTLLMKLFQEYNMAPLYTRLLQHLPDNNMEYIKTAVLSFAKYIATNSDYSFDKSDDDETNNFKFVSAVFNIIDNEDVLSCFLTSALSVITCDDPSPLIDLCLKAAENFNSGHTSSSLAFGEFVFGTSKLAISPSLPLRVLLRDCILRLFQLSMPAETSPLHFAGSKLSPAEVVSFASSLFDMVTSKLDDEQSCKLCLLAAQNRPLQFHHALFIRSLTNHAARSIVGDSRKTLLRFMEGAEEASEEAYSLCLETAVMLFKGDNYMFTDLFLSVPLTKFGKRLLEYFVRTPEHRDSYLSAYGKVISSLKFPTTPAEQSEFLASGYFHALYVMVNVDAASDALKQTFGQHVAHCITWLSLLFASTSALSKSLLKELTGHLTTTLEHIFARVGRSSNEPIELSLKTPRKLFLTLGTLANALMMVDFSMLVDFCRALFPLLSSTIPQIILTSGMVLARLLSRVSQLDSDASKILLPKLRESLAYSFVKANDESCRILSALCGETFNLSSINAFTDSDKVKLISGALHGLAFSGQEMRNENIAFVCKVARMTSKENLDQYMQQVWDFAVSSRSYETMTVLCKMDLKTEKIPVDIISEALVASTNADYPNFNECKSFIESIFGTIELKKIVSGLPTVFAGRFESIVDEVLKMITKGNASMAALDLIVYLTAGHTEKTSRVMSYLIAIVDDSEHVLREKASELIIDILSRD